MPRFGLTGRLVQLIIGLTLYGVALALMIRAGLGVSPWDVLSQGVSGKTGLSFGLVTLLIGAVVLLAWLPLQKPGVGTLLNVLIVGPAADVAMPFIPQPDQLWAQALLFSSGLGLLVIATGLYLGAGFGPGPRDGLMTAINGRWGFRVGRVRAVIELTVLTIGWLLGGTVGIGTLAFALLVGPLLQLALPWFMPAAVVASAHGAPAPVVEGRRS
jgi:uncharacterized membrane protein YczE